MHESQVSTVTDGSDCSSARNELWYVFELAKTLAASAGMPSNPPPEPIPSAPAPKKGKHSKGPVSTTAVTPAAGSAAMSAETELILPAGTYSATPGAAPTRSDVDTALALEMAIAAKQQALDDCSALIDAAVDELRLLNSASDQWSSDIRALRLGDNGRGQWAIVPKPDFGGRAGPNETAKDVVVPYALDEAPASLHASALAAFDLDPRKADVLQFGARSYRRLRVMLRTGGVGGPRTASTSYSAEGESGRGVRAMMEAAQLETLDEDLFNEIRAEAMRVDSAMIEQLSVALPIGDEKITFQLYDTREAPSPLAPQSPICDALLAHARIGILHTYRRRKQRVLEPATPAPSAAALAPTTPPVSILVPLVHLVQFHGACRIVKPTLDMFRQTLSSAGLSTALVERHSAAGNPDAILALLSAKAKIDVLGAVYTLELADWYVFFCASLTRSPGIIVNITGPSIISVVTQRSSFVLRDTDALSSIVADSLVAQLAPVLYDILLRLLEPSETSEESHRSHPRRVFFDELDGEVAVDAHGTLHISLPPPFDHITAYFDDEAVTPYDSRESAQSLVEWLEDVARGMPPVKGQEDE